MAVKSRPAGPCPRRRLRRHRRCAQAEGRRRRGRAGGQARLPHLPAAPVPARNRVARDAAPSDTRCATSSTAGQRRHPQGDGDGDRPRGARGSVRGMAPLSYDYLVLGLGAEVDFFGTEGAPSMPSRCTRSPTPCVSRSTCSTGGKRRTRIQAWSRTALSTSSSWAAGRQASRGGALAELYRGDFARTTEPAAGEGPHRARRGGPELFSMFKPNLRAYTMEALEKRTVEVIAGEAVEAVSRPGSRSSPAPCSRRTRSSGAQACRGTALVQALGLDLERGNRIGVGPDLKVPGHPEVYAVGDIGAITDAKTEQVLPSSGRLRCSPESTPAKQSPGALRARMPSRSSTATRGRWRRSVAERPSCRCWAAGP